MPAHAANARATIIPALSYRDPNGAVDWLVMAFGFEPHNVYKGDDGVVVHAELSFGNGMIMLGPARQSSYAANIVQPDSIGGKETQAPYVIVADADAHYRQAIDNGAVIVLDIKDEDYGGRAYTCRDLEGHIWTFGTYDPWTAK
jgi:uncharacterized glyoxalase superfamily protein PhnB